MESTLLPLNPVYYKQYSDMFYKLMNNDFKREELIASLKDFSVDDVYDMISHAIGDFDIMSTLTIMPMLDMFDQFKISNVQVGKIGRTVEIIQEDILRPYPKMFGVEELTQEELEQRFTSVMHRRFADAIRQKRDKSLMYCTTIAFIYIGCIVHGKHIVVTKLNSGNYHPVMENSPDVRVSGAVYFTEEESNE